MSREAEYPTPLAIILVEDDCLANEKRLSPFIVTVSFVRLLLVGLLTSTSTSRSPISFGGAR
jgi:hypothetical protein